MTMVAKLAELREVIRTLKKQVRLLKPWAGVSFADTICPFCGRRLVVDFHRSDCILYERR